MSNLEGELAALKVTTEALNARAQTTEANLAMREIQHKQTVTSLRNELSALRAQPSAEEEIVALAEKNKEYEELLRQKCEEIEENDDRFIE